MIKWFQARSNSGTSTQQEASFNSIINYLSLSSNIYDPLDAHVGARRCCRRRCVLLLGPCCRVALYDDDVPQNVKKWMFTKATTTTMVVKRHLGRVEYMRHVIFLNYIVEGRAMYTHAHILTRMLTSRAVLPWITYLHCATLIASSSTGLRHL